MTQPAIPEALLLKQIPALRNPRYRRIYFEARDQCLRSALSGKSIDEVPLHSHNATHQSLWSQGWRSITPQDIRLANAVGLREEIAQTKNDNLPLRGSHV